MNQEATNYATRVWSGQSVDAPTPWRVMRVGQALAGQGWMLKDAERLAPGWDRLVNEVTLETALDAFKATKGRPLAERVAAVETVLGKTGLPLSGVLKASKAYWKKLP